MVDSRVLVVDPDAGLIALDEESGERNLKRVPGS